jgi:hypothetical protein
VTIAGYTPANVSESVIGLGRCYVSDVWWNLLCDAWPLASSSVRATGFECARSVWPVRDNPAVMTRDSVLRLPRTGDRLALTGETKRHPLLAAATVVTPSRWLHTF